MFLTLLLTLAVSSDTPAPTAGPIVSLPKTIQADVGDLVVVKAESGAKLVTWDSTDGLTITIPKKPGQPLDPAMKEVAVHAKTAGTYGLTASIPNGEETRVAICLVTIGPRPPPPPPPPVDPVDKLAETFQNAYDSETDPARQAKLGTLGVIMSEAASQAGTAASLKSLADAVHKVSDAKIGAGSLNKVRSAVGVYLNGVLPTTEGPMTAEMKVRCQTAYQRVSDALGKVKP